MTWFCQERGTNPYSRNSRAHSFSHKRGSDVFREEVTFELDLRDNNERIKERSRLLKISKVLTVGWDESTFYALFVLCFMFLMWYFEQTEK